MKTTFPRLALMLVLLAPVGLSGCPVLLIGAGVAGGYAISKDSIRNTYDLPFERVYAASRAVADEHGAITLEDDTRGRIEATVGDTPVIITVKQLTKRSVELKVKARNVMPKIEVAQEIYTKINERL